MHQAISQTLQTDEVLILEVGQNFKRNLLSINFFIIPVIIFGLLLILMSNAPGATCTVNGVVKTAGECAGTLSVIAYGLLVAGIFGQLYVWISPLVTEYVVTDKRIIIKSGFIGADIRSIFYSQIKSVNVSVGLVDKMFGTGTVRFDTGLQTNPSPRDLFYTKMKGIDSPYEITKLIQSKIVS